MLEESYQNFINRIHELNNRIEAIQLQIINVERNADKDKFNEIDRDLSTLLSEIEILRAHGTELSSKSEKHTKIIEQELRTLIRNFDDLTRRNRFMQVSENL